MRSKYLSATTPIHKRLLGNLNSKGRGGGGGGGGGGGVGGGGGGGGLKKLTGLCGPGFRNHTLGYGDRGPKSSRYLWLRKMGENQTLHNRKCHQIDHF